MFQVLLLHTIITAKEKFWLIENWKCKADFCRCYCVIYRYPMAQVPQPVSFQVQHASAENGSQPRQSQPAIVGPQYIGNLLSR